MLEGWARERDLSSGFVLSCVGSLATATLRMAGASDPEVRAGPFEIVVLSGTLSVDGVHLHTMLSDAHGVPWAGHVCAGCTVATTLELVVGEAAEIRFRRREDPETGSFELVIEP